MNVLEQRKTIDEKLALAENSGDLSAGAGPRADVDMLIAAGGLTQKAGHVLGRALIALEAEWDASEQPRAPREHDIKAMAARLPARVDITTRGPTGQTVLLTMSREQAARHELESWYETERMRLIARLRALAPARAALTAWAQSKGMEKPGAKALGMLAWWLDHRCPKCFGTKLDPLPMGGRGSARVCKACHGLGERPLPYGQEGRALERHLIESRNNASRAMRSGVRRSRLMRERYAEFPNLS